MTFKSKHKKAGPVEVDLTGPDGNAFALMAYASRWARELDLDPVPILADMRSGNYEHLLEVLEKHFGKHVVFYR